MKETFETGWKFHLGDWKIIHPVKSGMAGGITDCEDIEDGEWLKILYPNFCNRRIVLLC